MSAAGHYDNLETRDPALRETSQFSLLPDLIRRAIERAPGWAAHLAGVDPARVTTREELARLPVLRKSALMARQGDNRPLGGFALAETGQLGRLFMSPGPIFEPEGRGDDWWRTARALFAAGFRAGDIVQNTFAYHMTPGGWIMDAGARKLGCAIIPAGTAATKQQLAAIAQYRPSGYLGVPDFLKILLDKAAESGTDASSITKALVSGGPLFPSLREEYAGRGITVRQAYATADLGVIAYESAAHGGMIVDEGVIVEIVRPGTGDPVADGEVGEVVVTSFNRDYPMIRLATGDMSAVLEGRSSCGRTNMRIKGWLGRADQAAKIRGMFVRPEQIADIATRHPELGRLRLVVSRTGEQDAMTLQAESNVISADLAETVATSLRAVTNLRGQIELVAPSSLPNDGKVIDDTRA